MQCESPCTGIPTGSYNVYLFYIAGVTCSQTTANSIVTYKGKLSTSFNMNSDLIVGGTPIWKNSETDISFGSYAEWFWLDTNGDDKLSAGEPIGCSDLQVASASIGSRPIVLSHQASSADASSNYIFTN